MKREFLKGLRLFVVLMLALLIVGAAQAQEVTVVPNGTTVISDDAVTLPSWIINSAIAGVVAIVIVALGIVGISIPAPFVGFAVRSLNKVVADSTETGDDEVWALLKKQFDLGKYDDTAINLTAKNANSPAIVVTRPNLADAAGGAN